MSFPDGRQLREMEYIARKQVVAILAASIIVARNATEPADFQKAWDDASHIAGLPTPLR